MKVILKELDEFGRVAGPNINNDKTALLWIGKKDNKWDISYLDLIWADGPIKYLGFFFVSVDEQVACKANWENKLEKMQRLLDNWRKRNLTLIFFGRVTILKSLALSQVVHLLMITPVPVEIIKKINKIKMLDFSASPRLREYGGVMW